MNTIVIDGSLGEGGGQVLRSSLTLSILTGTRLELSRIRAGRPKPGLMRQHRLAVEAACAISGGEARGAELGSTSLTFEPGKARAGDYTFAIATAGSVNLVLQTILLPLAMTDATSCIVLEGGTHNAMSPPYEFLQRTFLPILRRMGINVELTLERYGFHPAGGGRLVARIHPTTSLSRLDLVERGPFVSKSGRALYANLANTFASAQVGDLAKRLDWPFEAVTAQRVASAGPGNIIQVEIEHANICEVITAFVEKRAGPGTAIASIVADAQAYTASSAPVGEHLADQLLLPFALAGGGSFRTTAISEHTRTNAHVLERFLPIRVTFTPDDRGTLVELHPPRG